MEPQGCLPLRQLVETAGQGCQLRADQLQAELHSGRATCLLVTGAHLGPLVIAEQGQVVGSRDVPLDEFLRAAHIHHRPRVGEEGIHREGGAGARHR